MNTQSTAISPELHFSHANNSGELIPSISVERIIALRQEGLNIYLQGLELLEQAKELFKQACKVDNLTEYSKVVKDSVHWRETTDKKAQMIKRITDEKIWDHLMQETGMYTLMSEKQREEWNRQLYSEDMPEITLENVLTTFSQLNANKQDTFEQGVIDIFRNLSWNYKTNNPCKIGKKIISKRILSLWSSSRVTCCWDSKAKIDDLARPFYLLDGKNIPDFRVSEGVQYGDHFIKNNPYAEVFESEYFNIRTYMNGNVHITFNRLDLVDKINDIVAKHYPAMLAARV